MKVTDKEGARVACSILRELEVEGAEGADPASVISLKRAIRAWLNSVPETETVILSDNGVDGYSAITKLPAGVVTRRQAGAWFHDNIFAECAPSAYDCTAQRFTADQKLFQRGGRWCAFHRECFDV